MNHTTPNTAHPSRRNIIEPLKLDSRKPPVKVRRTRSASASSSSVLTHTQKSFTPITSHYKLNSTLYDAFFQILEKKRYKPALSVGVQFCRVSLFDIPCHGYYNTPKYHALKVQSAQNAVRVSNAIHQDILPRLERERRKNNNLSPHVEEKMQEAQVLREVAYGNMQLVQSNSASKQKQHVEEEERDDSLFIREKVVKLHDDDIDGTPKWLSILDCGGSNSMMNLCPPSLGNQLFTLKEEDESSNNVLTQSQAQKQKQQQLLTPLKEKKQIRNFRNVLPLEISRTYSAPAHLGSTSSPSEQSLMKSFLRDDASEERQNSSPTPENVSKFTDTNKNDYIPEECDEKDKFESDLERALYLSGMEFQSNKESCNFDTDNEEGGKNLKKVDSDVVDIQTLSSIYKEDFEDMQKNHKIVVTYIDTYQGRVPGSSNGCTVIAPLLAIHHLCDEEVLSERSEILMEGKGSNGSERAPQEQWINPAEDERNEEKDGKEGIDDETVRAVIDVQAPIVLPKVRAGLGLHKDALIIPSDVHDFLMNINMLKQSQFVDVCTGNILDDIDLSRFIEALSGTCTPKTPKSLNNENNLAATFYFHEHVISIHRVTRRTYTSVRDIKSSDSKKKSLAKKSSRSRMFNRLRGKSKKNKQQLPVTTLPHYDTLVDEESWFEIIDSLPCSSMLGNKNGFLKGIASEDSGSGWLPVTARIRCSDMRSLHACLRCYACTKFSSEDQKFINTYQWNHSNVDFDPRVFQAFLWSDC
mmetsp:Transcript_3830/g.4378  ORF Transcript_3830/g.4378 Transcript_3830/m.4378 type:complete len:753 (-) Transcript_3830:12-2270(-)